MKRLLKLGVAAFTALSMVGTPMTTFAESNDPEKEELTEHYWYDNENQKVYTFSEDGQWQAYDASGDAIQMELADEKTPSDTVLNSEPETGEYTWQDSHLTIQPAADADADAKATELDMVDYEINKDQITDENVKTAIQDYQGDYVLVDTENLDQNDPANYMVEMDSIDKDSSEEAVKDDSNTDDSATTDDQEATKDDATTDDSATTDDTKDDATVDTDKTDDSATTDDQQATKDDSTTDSTDTDTDADSNKILTSSLKADDEVYIAGNVFHEDEDCAGDDAQEMSVKEAVKQGYTPCDKEFTTDGFSFDTGAGEKSDVTINNNNVNVNVEINVQNNVLVVNDANGSGEVGTDEDAVSVNGKIVWKDNNNEYKVRPTKVTVILYRNDQQYKAIDVTGDATKDTWTFGFNQLAKADENGNAYKYTIKEKALAYYRGDLDGYVLTNTYVGQTPEKSSGSHTGSKTNMGLYVGVGAAAVAAIILIVVLNKKKQN